MKIIDIELPNRNANHTFKSAKPKNYLTLLFIPVAIAAVLVFGYCIWNIFPYFVAMAIAGPIAGPIAGYSISQLVTFFTD